MNIVIVEVDFLPFMNYATVLFNSKIDSTLIIYKQLPTYFKHLVIKQMYALITCWIILYISCTIIH